MADTTSTIKEPLNTSTTSGDREDIARYLYKYWILVLMLFPKDPRVTFCEPCKSG